MGGRARGVPRQVPPFVSVSVHATALCRPRFPHACPLPGAPEPYFTAPAVLHKPALPPLSGPFSLHAPAVSASASTASALLSGLSSANCSPAFARLPGLTEPLPYKPPPQPRLPPTLSTDISSLRPWFPPPTPHQFAVIVVCRRT